MNLAHRRPLPLDKLRTFEAVAHRLSFSAAAVTVMPNHPPAQAVRARRLA